MPPKGVATPNMDNFLAGIFYDDVTIVMQRLNHNFKTMQ
jgi:hypothetical protein